jgi:hypothetical protein
VEGKPAFANALHDHSSIRPGGSDPNTVSPKRASEQLSLGRMELAPVTAGTSGATTDVPMFELHETRRPRYGQSPWDASSLIRARPGLPPPPPP